VPVLILVNTADDACPTTHTDAIYAAIPHDDKEMHRIEGANHYYSGSDQRHHLGTAISTMQDWVKRHDFID
jgi:esterase/lipase